MTSIEFLHFSIGMMSVLLGMVFSMVVFGVLHDYYGWFQ